LLLHRNWSFISVLDYPVLHEVVGTIAPPGATRRRAVDPVREVNTEVSVPLLPTGE
jgi:hypothetical protein